MEDTIMKRIQALVHKLEFCLFLTSEQRKQLRKEIVKLDKQLQTLRKTLNETENNRFKK